MSWPEIQVPSLSDEEVHALCKIPNLDEIELVVKALSP